MVILFLLYYYFGNLCVSSKKIILCEEKTKIIWCSTYKFGILKYIMAGKNEVGSIIFNTVNKHCNEVLILKKVLMLFYLIVQMNK